MLLEVFTFLFQREGGAAPSAVHQTVSPSEHQLQLGAVILDSSQLQGRSRSQKAAIIFVPLPLASAGLAFPFRCHILPKVNTSSETSSLGAGTRGSYWWLESFLVLCWRPPFLAPSQSSGV